MQKNKKLKEKKVAKDAKHQNRQCTYQLYVLLTFNVYVYFLVIQPNKNKKKTQKKIVNYQRNIKRLSIHTSYNKCNSCVKMAITAIIKYEF